MNKEKHIYQQVLLLLLQLHWLINKRLFADIFEFFIQYMPCFSEYTYDVLNRLLSETTDKTQSQTSKNGNTKYGFTQDDVTGSLAVKYASANTQVDFDYYATSIGVDLGTELDVNSVVLIGKSERLKGDYLELYSSTEGTEDSYKKVSDVIFTPTATGLKAIFAQSVKARFFKVHSTWDERNEDYLPVNKSQIRGELADLVEVIYTVKGKTNIWTYDAKGNRLTDTEEIGASKIKSVIEYKPNSDLITKYGNWTFTYDANGNMTGKESADGRKWIYEYDLSNRLIKVRFAEKGKSLEDRASYKYDYRGLCVQKTTTDFAEYSEYTSDGRLIYTVREEEESQKETCYIWTDNTLWAEIQNDEVFYHHTDQLGTTECVTDSNGNLVWESEYEAFGSVMSTNGTKDFAPSFTGKRFDEEVGLYYFNARWYDAELGRFVSEDPARDGVNWYGYCGNNPCTRVDVNGLEQTPAQKILTKAISFGVEKSDKFAAFVKNNTTIEVQRSADDNGNNGKYYKSETSVKFLGIKLNSVPVQSTADHPNLNSNENDKTLDKGTYNGNMLLGSGSYNNPIQLINDENGATILDNFMIHPDQFTKKTGGPWSQPYSKGCQIMPLDDFNEMNEILDSLGFERSGQLSDRKKNGSQIKVVIR